jgi:hypothetical protein
MVVGKEVSPGGMVRVGVAAVTVAVGEVAVRGSSVERMTNMALMPALRMLFMLTKLDEITLSRGSSRES